MYTSDSYEVKSLMEAVSPDPFPLGKRKVNMEKCIHMREKRQIISTACETEYMQTTVLYINNVFLAKA